MANKNGTRMRAVQGALERSLDLLAETRQKLQTQFEATCSFALAYHAARERYQLELWQQRGKRLCPRCGKLRGAKTFGWVYSEPHLIIAARLSETAPCQIVYMCRACRIEVLAEKDDIGSCVAVSEKDGVFYRGKAVFRTDYCEVIAKAPPLSWNDDRFEIGDDIEVPEQP